MRVQLATSLAGTVPKAAWEDSTPAPFPEWSSLQVASKSRATTALLRSFMSVLQGLLRAGDRTVIQRFPSPQWHFLCSQLSLLRANAHDSESSRAHQEMDLGVLGEVDRRARASYPIDSAGGDGAVIGNRQIEDGLLV